MYYSWLVFVCFNTSWLCGNWRKHHKYHLHLLQEGYEEVNVQYIRAYYILQRPINVLMLAIDALFAGLSPTYRVQPKPHWQSAAAQYTLSSGQRREKVRILISLFNRGRTMLLFTCSQSLCFTCAVCNLNFSSVCPQQMALLRLSTMLSTCHTVWCLLWHLRTPSYYMTRSRHFPLAWWPTFTITHWVTLHGKAAPLYHFELSYQGMCPCMSCFLFCFC